MYSSHLHVDADVPCGVVFHAGSSDSGTHGVSNVLYICFYVIIFSDE